MYQGSDVFGVSARPIRHVAFGGLADEYLGVAYDAVQVFFLNLDQHARIGAAIRNPGRILKEQRQRQQHNNNNNNNTTT